MIGDRVKHAIRAVLITNCESSKKKKKKKKKKKSIMAVVGICGPRDAQYPLLMWSHLPPIARRCDHLVNDLWINAKLSTNYSSVGYVIYGR